MEPGAERPAAAARRLAGLLSGGRAVASGRRTAASCLGAAVVVANVAISSGAQASSDATDHSAQGPEHSEALPAAVGLATGRLNHAGYSRRRHCTAFLVDPELIATAAHCLAGLPADEFHLLLGYRAMSWTEHLRTTLIPTLDADRDVGFACLASPAAARPFPLGSEPVPAGTTVTVLGYGRPAVHRAQERTCSVVGPVNATAFMIDCGLAQGFSGGPVFFKGPDGPEIVGLVSRSARSYAIVATIGPGDIDGACGPGATADPAAVGGE